MIETPTVRYPLSHPPRLIRVGRGRVAGDGEFRYESSEYWALHLYFGKAQFEIAGHAFELHAGTISLSPVSELSIYKTGEPLDHIFVHFAPGAPDAPDSSDSPDERMETAPLPLEVGPTSRAETAAQRITECLKLRRVWPRWAELKLWDALYELSRLSSGGEVGPEEHPVVEQARTFIDLHLPESISLDRLAGHCGVSATHLNRLFVAATGESAIRYVRGKRMELAHYLLCSTSVPVKDVAYQVGIPDLHAFNKLCKRWFGAPPTELRR